MPVTPPELAPLRSIICIACSALAAGAFLVALPGCGNRSSEELIADARAALAQGEFGDAETLAQQALARDPSDIAALLVAGEAAARQERVSDAIAYLDRIPDDGSPDAIAARGAAGELVLRKSGDVPQAERLFRRAWQQDHNNPQINHYLAYLVGLTEGGSAAVPYRLAALRSRNPSPLHLQALARRAAVVELPETLERYRKATPDDPALATAWARQLLRQNQPKAAIALLREVVRQPQHPFGAEVELGDALLQSGDVTGFLEWHAHLPQEADESADIWRMRGEFARARQLPEAAVRCLWESVLRDPHQPLANYQLGQLLVGLNRQDAAAPFLERARQLELYVKTIDSTTETVTEATRACAELAESLGLTCEACGWSRWALSQQPGLPWADAMAQRLEPHLKALGDARSLTQHNPALALDLSSYAVPEWEALSPQTPQLTAVDAPGDSIRFDDDASRAGILFAYFNGGDPTHGMTRMYEFTGGGAAAVDYDVDGWPDLYLTQGCRWPVQSGNAALVDRLFRNRGDSRFRDVTAPSALSETGFSQGVAVGDFDNDGFPDVYVGNIGANRCYHNNGDGTFTDITDETGTAGSDWSTSCLIADLNGDPHPDLFVVNYLGGDDVFTRVCGNESGASLCLPQYFDGAQDRLYLNNGDGTFDDVTETAGIVAPDGRGLGIVAGEFTEHAGLEVFIANDLAPNFFFVNQQAQPGGRPQFREEALLRGLAVNGAGQFEACMGVAAGDANDDGLCDLFVTNFDLETNTLYQQEPGAMFADAKRASGLGIPGDDLLGWGTQFLDADLDGDLDVVIANGHIDDGRSLGRLYQMPPQFFENVGGGRFVPARRPGAYFLGDYLGRGLARLDWNRDGREDFVVSHLDRPLALLTNRTDTSGRFLKLRLAGVRCERRASGAIATLMAGGRRFVRHLTVGDGYHASNEPVLTFGLNTGDDRIDSLEIRWPGGETQSVAGARFGSECLVIEGRTQAIELRKVN